MNKFVRANIIANFTGGKNTVFEADELAVTESRKCINVNPNLKRGIQPRKGIAIDGTFSTTATPITSAHTFTNQYGNERPLRASGTIVEYRNPFVTTPDWFTLETGFTSGKIFGFVNGDTNEYFCNGVEVIRRWTGAVAKVDLANTTDTILAFDSETENGITLNTAEKLGFSATGSVIIYANGVYTVKTYTGRSGLTLTGLSGLNALTIADNDPVAEAPITTGFTSAPIGNILLIKDSRLLVAGVSGNENSVYGSKVGNVRDFSFSTPAAADDGFVVKFWGKPITALGDKGDYIAVMKKDGAKKLGFTTIRSASADTILTVPKLDGLYDAPNLGAVNMKSTLQSNLDFVFTSKETGLRRITRLGNDAIDKPDSLTSDIEDEFIDYDLSDAACGLRKQQIHLALRSSSDLTGNDTIILKDQRTGFIGDYKGINASCFYQYNNQLYCGDAFTKNCWQMYTDDYADFDGTDYFSYIFLWLSGQLNFGYPDYLKKLGFIYIEGYITPNTTADFEMIFETESGTQSIVKQLEGTADYVYKSPGKVLGLNKLGEKGLADSDDEDLPPGSRKFRKMFTEDDYGEIDWFTLQLLISTDADGSYIRITKIRPFIQLLPIDKVKNNSIIN